LNRNTIVKGAAVAVALVAVGTGTATAASQLTAHDLATGAANSRVIKDGSVHARDLTDSVRASVNSTGTLSGQVDSLTQQVDALNQQVADLGGQIDWKLANGAWTIDNGAGQITGKRTADLTLICDKEPTCDGIGDTQFGASLSNDQVVLPYIKGDTISFTYSLADGAAQGWGAPRLIVQIDDHWYSTINDVNPNYGVDNGDGTFTQTAVPDLMNDNKVTNPSDGTITAVAVVYDNLPAPGTVHVSNVDVAGHQLNFQ
jgi:hypothetical protein